MSKVKTKRVIINPYGDEPRDINSSSKTYKVDIIQAFNWYGREKDKKDAIQYLRSYITKHNKQDLKLFDKVSDSEINITYGWLARLSDSGSVLSDEHTIRLNEYIQGLFVKPVKPKAEKTDDTPVKAKASVRDNMMDKVNEYIDELDGAIDDFIKQGKEFQLFADLNSKAIPKQYCQYIEEWVRNTITTYTEIYKSKDPYIIESYSNFGKRKLTQFIKMCNNWLDDISKYAKFKVANKKPRVKKAKPAAVQIAKLKYKKEDTELKIKSVSPLDIVGASQVWLYNTKYKKLSVYRTDSTQGLQVKGTSLQNYDPDMCEQKALRKPAETLKLVLDAGKVQLRKIISDLTTKESPVNGRINEECIIVRIIK